ncbi:MAG: aminotransferase class I/II-fold pyridoxal phosphate-dependent enzyme [Gloeomargarita sp. SKYG116]|nr:aminotransferase class I/II-fold pyridoxal phosphate-dependent enzyme [Gloeomargarita sp. SKYG116]MDW8401192.1 aminotransferase class I/II-fold pyridoxal phosphate-dependent enzyme [Gloeomargarita sp. SKYGB_i_bin116]
MVPRLVQQLQHLAQGYRGFHTPGHQRGKGAPDCLRQWWGEAVFQADLSEIPGLDNLAQPDGLLRDAQARVAEIFGAQHTWFLVNGATAGVLAALLAVHRPGGQVILPRNVHQSVIHGLMLTGAEPIFLTPAWDAQKQVWGGITPAQLTAAFQQSGTANITAVVLNSPTYKGVCGPVAECIAIAHQHHVPVIVDEAHGAHFPFHPALPPSALTSGADLVIHSTHKVLTSLTQSALLHLQGTRVSPQRVQQCLNLIQTTSPSYLLLASLAASAEQMAAQGEPLFEALLNRVGWLIDQIQQLPGYQVLRIDTAIPGFAAQDPTRLVVQTQRLGLTGFALDEWLHTQHRLTAECPGYSDVTFILTPWHSDADCQALVSALAQGSPQPQPLPPVPLPPVTKAVLSLREAFFAPHTLVPWSAAVGRVSAAVVSPYPPGIPVLLPGEFITAEVSEYLTTIQRLGGHIIGLQEQQIAVLSNW